VLYTIVRALWNLLILRKPEGKILLWKPCHLWRDNIKTDLKNRHEIVDLINLTQEMDGREAGSRVPADESSESVKG
jgi:hypothetical protein